MTILLHSALRAKEGERFVDELATASKRLAHDRHPERPITREKPPTMTTILSWSFPAHPRADKATRESAFRRR